VAAPIAAMWMAEHHLCALAALRALLGRKRSAEGNGGEGKELGVKVGRGEKEGKCR